VSKIYSRRSLVLAGLGLAGAAALAACAPPPAQSEATAAVRPGVACERIDGVARGIIDAAGYGDRFIHRTGHGIGLEGHEEPYLVAGSTEPLAPGMAFSVEPGIYLEGRYGARIEDIVVCGDEGADRLNNADRELVVVAP